MLPPAPQIDPIAQALFVLSKTGKPTERPEPGTRFCGVATVRVAFDLRVGEPYQQRVTQSIPWQRIAAVALAKLNDASMAKVLEQALDEEVQVEAITERAKRYIEPLLRSSVKTCAGKVTGSTNIVEATFDNLSTDPA